MSLNSISTNYVFNQNLSERFRMLSILLVLVFPFFFGRSGRSEIKTKGAGNGGGGRLKGDWKADIPLRRKKRLLAGGLLPLFPLCTTKCMQMAAKRAHPVYIRKSVYRTSVSYLVSNSRNLARLKANENRSRTTTDPLAIHLRGVMCGWHTDR